MKIKNLSGMALVIALAGTAGADLVYSNNFADAEFKATGVGAVSTLNTAESGGFLVSTRSNSGTGWRVDLSALNLATDNAISEVKITALITKPTESSQFTGIGFTDSGDNNLANHGLPWASVVNTGMVRTYPGLGAVDVQAVAGAAPNATALMEFSYFKSGHVSLVVDGTLVVDKRAITPTEAIDLQYAHINLRNTTTSQVDWVTIEAIPEPATLGLLAISSAGMLLLRRTLSL